MKATILLDPQDPFYSVIFTDKYLHLVKDIPKKTIEIDESEEKWIRKTVLEMDKLQEWLENKFSI